MKEFKVGDRVKVTGREDKKVFNEHIGTIIAVTKYHYSIEFDEYIGGHVGFNGRGVNGHCWNFNKDGDCKIKLIEKETIVIYRNGDEVIAKDKTTGKTACAKCHKDDKFDFMVGAKLAFDRLEEKSHHEEKKDFKVGDRVRIRQWDDMVKEFGTLNNGKIINCYCRFVDGMKHLCGRTATIRLVNRDGSCSLEFDDNFGDLMWEYSLSMLEPIPPVGGKDILLETDKILVYKENGKTHIEVMD